MNKKEVQSQLLDGVKDPIVFVDVGSRNGMLELEGLAKFTHAYGFEPNPEEYRKLVENRTDLLVQVGISSPKYAKLEYSPYALFNKCGREKFFITRGPGACGLYRPNYYRLNEIIWKGRRFKESFGKDIFEILNTEDVDVKTLAWFCKQKAISYIDFLKIDTEGTDYEVLEGGGDIIHRTGVIKVEVCFIPFRDGQKLFSEIDILLRSKGFDLLGYERSPIAVGYKERDKPVDYAPALGFEDRYGQLLQADAVYVNREIREHDRILAQAAVLIEKDRLDEALFILKRKANLDDNDILGWLESYEMHYLDAKSAYGGRILILNGIAKAIFDGLRVVWRKLKGRGRRCQVSGPH